MSHLTASIRRADRIQIFPEYSVTRAVTLAEKDGFDPRLAFWRFFKLRLAEARPDEKLVALWFSLNPMHTGTRQYFDLIDRSTDSPIERRETFRQLDVVHCLSKIGVAARVK